MLFLFFNSKDGRLFASPHCNIYAWKKNLFLNIAIYFSGIFSGIQNMQEVFFQGGMVQEFVFLGIILPVGIFPQFFSHHLDLVN